jgi:hypothetical protein
VDRHDQPDAADCLLRHHTDLPVDMFTGRHPVGPEYGRVGSMAAQQLTDLDAVLASSDAFASHLQAGGRARRRGAGRERFVSEARAPRPRVSGCDTGMRRVNIE